MGEGLTLFLTRRYIRNGGLIEGTGLKYRKYHSHLFQIILIYNKYNFISDNDIQMGRPTGKHVMTINEQDSEPTYQGLIIENGTLTIWELPDKLGVVVKGRGVVSHSEAVAAAVNEKT